MPKKKESFGSEVYTGVADFGVIIADLKAIGGVIIGLIFIGIGIYLLVQKITRTATVTGTVLNVSNSGGNSNNPSCTPTSTTTTSNSGSTTNTYWECIFDVKYTVGDKDYTAKGQETRSIYYKGGESIPIFYNPDNPNDASISDDYSHTVGWILIVIGVVIALSGIIWAWLANKYKIIGAYEGATTGIRAFRQAI
jgi:hypothetical protein